MSLRDTSEMKKELETRRRKVLQLESEIKSKDLTIQELEHIIRNSADERQRAQEILTNMESIIQERCNKIQEQERARFESLIQKLEAQNNELKIQMKMQESNSLTLASKQSEIDFLTRKLTELASTYGATESIKDLKEQLDINKTIRAELDKKNRDMSELQTQAEGVISENRVLREMAGVPSGYGVNLNEITQVEAQRIEEYKARVHILEQEVEALEQECTELRFRLRNMAGQYSGSSLPQQNLPENSNLRERSTMLEKEVERLRAELRLIQSVVDRGDISAHEAIIKALRQESYETKDLLLKLYGGKRDTPDKPEQIIKNGLQLPPIPIANENGDFTSGYSYRFSGILPMADIYTGDSTRDRAALQLQVVELIELMRRRDEDEHSTHFELTDIRKKLREILLVIDQIFKDHQEAIEQHSHSLNEAHTHNEDILSQLRAARAQIQVFEDMAKSQTDSKETSKLGEFASRLALSEAKNVILERKHENLVKEAQEMKDAYMRIECEHAEKDVIICKKIGQFKEWRASASIQMQFLFQQLRQSVSQENYERVSSELQILKSRQSEWLLREANMHKKLATLESVEQENIALHDKNREMHELKLEVLSELELVSKRLETVDHGFKREQQALRKLIQHLRSRFITGAQAFGSVDINTDGKISRVEFRVALQNMGLGLLPEQLEALFDSLDQDADGNIRYNEFLRKLHAYGLQESSEEQQILQKLLDGMMRSGLSLKEVFDIFDSDGSGHISQEELVSCLMNFEVGLTLNQVQMVGKLIDLNKDDQITFNEFSKIFHTPNQIDWKDEVLSKIRSANKDLHELFILMDEDEDGMVSRDEFVKAIKGFDQSINNFKIDELWNMMNTDRDAFISYTEFLIKVKANEREENTRKVILSSDRSQNHRSGKDKRLLALLDAKLQTANSKAERYLARIKTLQLNNQDTERQLLQSDQKYIDSAHLGYLLKQQISTLKSKLSRTVTRGEAERLRQNNQILRKELTEARAGIYTYKSLINVAGDQVRILNLTVEKRRDQMDTLQKALREIKSESPHASTLGNLYQQLMVARWEESSANRKFDSLLSETRALRTENFKLEGQLLRKDTELNDVHATLTQKVAVYEEQIRELRLKAEGNCSLQKAEELVAQVRQMGRSKTLLEEANRGLAERVSHLEGQINEAQILKQTADEMMETLREEGDIGLKLTELAKRISQIRLDELKAKREATLSKDKELYYQRLHNQDVQTIKSFEQEVTRWETLLNTREQAWRKKDGERQKMLLNPKYGRETVPEVKSEAIEDQPLQKQTEIELPVKVATDTSGMQMRLESLQFMLDKKTDKIAVLEGTIHELQSLLNQTKERAAEELKRMADEMRAKPVVKQTLSARPKATANKQIDNRLNKMKKELEDAKYQLNIEKSKHSGYDYKSKLDETRKELGTKTKELASKSAELSKLKKCFNDLKEDLNNQALKNAGLGSEAYTQRPNLLAPQSSVLAPGQATLGSGVNHFASRESPGGNLLAPSGNPLAPSGNSLAPSGNPLAPSGNSLAPSGNPLEPSGNPLAPSQDSLGPSRGLAHDFNSLVPTDLERTLRGEIQQLRISLTESRRSEKVKQDLLEKSLLQSQQARQEPPQFQRVHSKQPKRPQESIEIRELKQTVTRLEAELKVKKKAPILSADEERVLYRLKSLLQARTLQSVFEASKKVLPTEFYRILESKVLGLSMEELNTITNFATHNAPVNIKMASKEVVQGISIKKISGVVAKLAMQEPSLPNEPPKRMERKLHLMLNQLTEQKKEIQLKDRQVSYWESQARLLKKEKNRLEHIPVTQTQTGMLSIQETRADLFQSQKINQELQMRLQSSLADIEALIEEKNKLADQAKRLNSQIFRMDETIAGLRSSRLRSILGVEQDEARLDSLRIKELQMELDAFSGREAELRQIQVRLKKDNLEMKFNNDQYTAQIARLNRRIRELEEFKNAFIDEKPLVRLNTVHPQIQIQEETAVPEQMKENTQILDSYKRLVEKLRYENEGLKRISHEQLKKTHKFQDQQMLEHKCVGLQEELRELRTRENITRGLESKMKRLNESNELLRTELDRQVAAVGDTEHRYRGLMFKYEALLRDHEHLRGIVSDFR